MSSCLKKLLIRSIPLTVYLEQLSLIIITKGLGQIDGVPALVQSMYYVYVGSVYAVQIIKFLLNFCFSGYKRGFSIHMVTTLQLCLQIIIVLGAITYISEQPYWSWIWWEFILFIGAWGFTIIARFFYVILIFWQVLQQHTEQIELKESYWLLITTKDELYENKGRLTYEPRQYSNINLVDSLIHSQNDH